MRQAGFRWRSWGVLEVLEVLEAPRVQPYNSAGHASSFSCEADPGTPRRRADYIALGLPVGS